jgi:hypothetical protein
MGTDPTGPGLKKRFALFDLLKSLYSDTKIFSKYSKPVKDDLLSQIYILNWNVVPHVNPVASHLRFSERVSDIDLLILEAVLYPV